MKKYKVRILLPSRRYTWTTVEASDFTGARELVMMMYGASAVVSVPELIQTDDNEDVTIDG